MWAMHFFTMTLLLQTQKGLALMICRWKNAQEFGTWKCHLAGNLAAVCDWGGWIWMHVIGCVAGVTDLSDPGRYFMGTESQVVQQGLPHSSEITLSACSYMWWSVTLVYVKTGITSASSHTDHQQRLNKVAWNWLADAAHRVGLRGGGLMWSLGPKCRHHVGDPWSYVPCYVFDSSSCSWSCTAVSPVRPGRYLHLVAVSPLLTSVSVETGGVSFLNSVNFSVETETGTWVQSRK